MSLSSKLSILLEDINIKDETEFDHKVHNFINSVSSNFVKLSISPNTKFHKFSDKISYNVVFNIVYNINDKYIDMEKSMLYASDKLKEDIKESAKKIFGINNVEFNRLGSGWFSGEIDGSSSKV